MPVLLNVEEACSNQTHLLKEETNFILLIKPNLIIYVNNAFTEEKEPKCLEVLH